MINSVNSIDDVKLFVKDLMGESLNYHPDNDFRDYINISTGLPSYNEEDAMLRNKLNSDCFEVCSKYHYDLYELSMEIYLKFTGIDKYISL